MRRMLITLAAIAIVASLPLATQTVAAAHERRSVGPYQLVVGFLTEPAFAGQPNGVDLRVTDARATPPRNVEGLENDVRVQIFSGGLSTSLQLKVRARFGLPGQYAADFIPTRDGAYRFVFTGKIEQVALNETFESGPGRFGDVEATTALQYPDKVPAGADLTERIADLERDLGSARAFAIVALVLAIVLPLGAVARARRR